MDKELMYRLAWVKALKSFGTLREGDVLQVRVTRPIASLIVNHYLMLIPDPPDRSHSEVRE